MSDIQLLITIGEYFAYFGGFSFIAIGLYLSFRLGRLHPLMLGCISAMATSWIEAPYDWAVYAQFPPELSRMPEWWPMNMTWGGLPAAVPPGYVSYFLLPAVISIALARAGSKRFGWRRPLALLSVGFIFGCIWAFFFNAIFGARLGVFYYGYVIEGLALWPGTKHQYPLYDTLAMGVQMMLFTYIIGRTDSQGRTFIDIWADSKTSSFIKSQLLSVAAIVVIGHAVYLGVFAPHLATKLMGLVNVGPSEQLFEGAPNQPR
jgi:hypothetical protein